MKSLLLQLTGEMPLFKIIDFLVENKGIDFTKKEIAEGSNISRASLFNYWEELEKNGIVKITRRIGKARLYTLNSESPITKKILGLEKELITKDLFKAPDATVSAQALLKSDIDLILLDKTKNEKISLFCFVYHGCCFGKCGC